MTKKRYAKPERAFCITAMTTTPEDPKWRNLSILTNDLLKEIEVYSTERTHFQKGEISSEATKLDG